MAETKKAPSNIILGSGYIYYQDFSGETVPDVDTICTEANENWHYGIQRQHA